MEITFKLSKKYTLKAVPVTITFEGTTLKAYCPETPIAGWSLIFGSGYSPLFYEDQSAVLGNYKANRGTAICQLLYDVNNKRLVTEFVLQKKGMLRLLEIVNTRLAPGVTMFK
jgi:hypothetical protein